MALICDTSAIISLAFDDEDAAYAQAVIEAIAADRAIVPALFWFEIRNTLLMGERRKRSTVVPTTFIADLGMLPFEIDNQPPEAGVLDLARRYALTVYDATYLELAQRKHLPLATIDRALLRAAKAVGVLVWKVPR